MSRKYSPHDRLAYHLTHLLPLQSPLNTIMTILKGIVTKAGVMQKTVTVTVERKIIHPKLLKVRRFSIPFSFSLPKPAKERLKVFNSQSLNRRSHNTRNT